MDDQCALWNKRGIFPGPSETLQQFSLRVAAIEKKELPPHDFAAHIPSGAMQEGQSALQQLYDCAPDWVQGYYDDRYLPPWQGAAAWFYEAEGAVHIPLIQLRTAFRKGSYLKCYHRTEVLAHELAHCARFMFKEPKFEELLAYRTAKNPFRRWFGPLFRHSWESYLFAILLLCPLIGNFLILFWHSSLILEWFANLPWLMLGFLLIRLWATQRTFTRAIKHIQPHLKEPQMAYAVAFRLTDREIADFSALSFTQIKRYIATQSSLRWDLLKHIYFKGAFTTGGDEKQGRF